VASIPAPLRQHLRHVSEGPERILILGWIV
jgi:hypothetical protein